jgi:glucokinase
MSVALLADIGGTNVRFATLTGDGRIEAVEAWLTAIYPDIGAAVVAYAETTGLSLPVDVAAVCAAGPLDGDRIVLTNCPWTISRGEMAAFAKRTVLVNDFAAVAYAVPSLGASDLRQIGGAVPVEGAAKLALGPGTGLGIASVVADGRGGWIVLPGEGGHADLAATTEREIAVVYQLMREYGHVSVERVVSGPGLEALYLALAALDGVGRNTKPAAQEIAAAARAKKDPLAVEAVALFTGWLGSVAGNFALTVGARGGVYIAGGIVSAWGDLFDAALFRRRFEAKGRMKSFLSPIPCYVVTAKDLAFRGLATLARQED